MADPALFFDKKGPRYETWLSTVKLAKLLNVPHLLFTINKNNPNEEIVGITVIDKLETSGINYVNSLKPCNNIHSGIESISKYIFELIKTSKAPTIK